MKPTELLHDKEVLKNRKLIKKMVRIIASCETERHIENTDKLISSFHLKYGDDMLNRTFRALLYYHEYNLSKK